MASELAVGIAVPEVNDLVRVTVGAVDDPDAARLASDVPSRVEDVDRNPKTGKTVGYLIAAPLFSGDLEPPARDTECLLIWPTPRGLCMLPVAFVGQESTSYGLRVWRVRITGPLRREERRQFVRVPWALPTRLEVRRDLEALGPQMRRLVEQGSLRAALAHLPTMIEAEAVNVSEGGLLCMSPEPVLPAHLPLLARFTIDSTTFEIGCRVVWSELREQFSDRNVESALVFDDPGRYGEVLRPLLFQAQLRGRRAGVL